MIDVPIHVEEPVLACSSMPLNATVFFDDDDFCQNIRQDFDIYLNIDHQKAKKLKKEQRRRTRHTNKQAIKQINKRTDEETTKTTKKQQRQTSRVACFFFGPMQWLEPLRVVKRNKSKDNKQAITRTNTKS